MEPLETPNDDRIHTQVVLIQIPFYPDRIIGAASILVASAVDPMINHMVDSKGIPKVGYDLLQSFMSLGSLELL